MIDWEHRAVPGYSTIRKLPREEARTRILEWLASDDPLRAAGGAHLVWDHIGSIFTELLPDVASTYWTWHQARADRDPRWLVRGSCACILMSMKWPHDEVFRHAFANARLEKPAPADPEFAKYYSYCGQPPAEDPTPVVRFNALSALRALGAPNIVSLAETVAAAPEEYLRVLAAEILAEADPAGMFSKLLLQAETISIDQVEQFSKSAAAALRAGGDGARESCQQLLLKCSGECLRVTAYDLSVAKLPLSVSLLLSTLHGKTDLHDRANLLLDLINSDVETRLKVVSLLPSARCDGEADFIIRELVKWDNADVNSRLLEVAAACGDRLCRYAVAEMQSVVDRRSDW